MGILAAARSSTCTIRFEMPGHEPALSYQYVPGSDNQAGSLQLCPSIQSFGSRPIDKRTHSTLNPTSETLQRGYPKRGPHEATRGK